MEEDEEEGKVSVTAETELSRMVVLLPRGNRGQRFEGHRIAQERMVNKTYGAGQCDPPNRPRWAGRHDEVGEEKREESIRGAGCWGRRGGRGWRRPRRKAGVVGTLLGQSKNSVPQKDMGEKTYTPEGVKPEED